MSFTVLTKYGVVMHHPITLPYLVIALMDLVVTPGGIQHITQTRLLVCSSHTNSFGV